MADVQDNNAEADSNPELEETELAEEITWFDMVQGAALVAKTSFSDQIDYFNPEEDEII